MFFSLRIFQEVSFAVLLTSMIVMTSAHSVFAGSSNSLLDISQDGKLLACSNRDSGTVTIVELATHRVLREIPVGKYPEGVSFVGNSHQLAVAIYADDQVIVLDALTGKISNRIYVFDEPYGIVSSRDGSSLYVTLDYPGQVLEIDASSGTIRRTIPVGKFIRAIAISADNQFLLTTEYYTGLVRKIDLEKGKTIDQWPGGKTDNLSRQIIFHPTRPKAYFPHIRSRVTVAHGAGSIFPLLTVIDTEAGKGKRKTRIPLDSLIGTRVTSNPWEVAISPDGKTLLVVFAGTDDLYVCNVLDDNYREVTARATLYMGHNPRAVRVAADGKTFYVYNALDFNIVAFATDSLKAVATIPVTENPLSEQVLLGKKLFYSARQPMSGRLWISCASCHPDGQPDGKTWHNPEGLRNTQSLAGMAWTHPIHWSADRDEVQDFEHTIRGPLMQGRGLVRGKINPSLGKPNKGLSEALDAMAAYSNTHKFSISPHSKKGLSESAKRGRAIFFSPQTACASCHCGPFYTDSNPKSKKIIRHDVGTAKWDKTEKMEPAYDTPTLLGLYRTAPYLHHGLANNLQEVLTTYNRDDQHGKTSHLSPTEISDLIEFLKALPYENPVPQAQKTDLVEVKN